jgi:hypothetical protein
VSANTVKKSEGYSPARPSKFTVQDIQALKELIEATPLKWWIVAAGAGCIREAMQIVWLAFRFAFRF